jgi:antitoxin VapB
MPISIKNEETEQLARDLAQLTGESITDAVRISVAERYERLRRSRAGRSLEEVTKEIAARYAKMPDVSNLTDDEILGYDEFGIPTK